MATTFVCRNVSGSFTDYFQCSNYSEVCPPIGAESLEIHVFDKRKNLVGGLQYIV